MNWSKKIGDKGEGLALEYIQNLGYSILATNWRYRHKEVDIIAIDAGFLVFVEVKTRSNTKFGEPYEAVTAQKEKFLLDAAEHYIEEKEIDKEVRFDIISIELNQNTSHINHIKDAFHDEL